MFRLISGLFRGSVSVSDLFGQFFATIWSENPSELLKMELLKGGDKAGLAAPEGGLLTTEVVEYVMKK